MSTKVKILRRQFLKRSVAAMGAGVAAPHVIAASALGDDRLKFQPHVLFTENSGNWAQTGVADIDKDGRLDFIAGNYEGIYWWQNPGTLSGQWKKHTIARGSPSDVGGAAMDVDGDGWIDWVSSGFWFQNPGKPTTEPWKKFRYGEARRDHDVVLVDIDGDGRLDVVRNQDQLTQWAKMPPKDQVEGLWTETKIVSGHKGGKLHGGFAPKGWGDINGDGHVDLVGVQYWFENVDGKGKVWRPHEYTTWGKPGIYGWEVRVWVADIDGDGDLDIAISEGDSRDGRAAWIENKDGKGGEWETHELPLGDIKGDLHSIAVLDFDGDGDMDIFVAQNGPGTNNAWLIFENVDGKGRFEKREIYRGYGAHETLFADFDGDGDIDILSKCWGSPTTFVLLENKLDPQKRSL
jgi:hypothetical protein